MIRTEQAHLVVAARTHPGMTGKGNEDRYAVSAFRLSEAQPLPVVLALVADGVGGNRAGEVAAELAVEIISEQLAADEGLRPIEALDAAFQAANQAIYTQALADPTQLGMGTTCVCAWVIGSRLYAAWVGDSRLYLVRHNTIQRLSIDHTFVQEAIDQGVLTPDEARNAPARHVIHRYLGMPRPVETDFRLRLKPGSPEKQAQADQGFELLPGDILLLCSDGLTDLVQEAEILPVLLHTDLEQALDSLVDLANQRGGRDNITVIGLQMPGVSAGVETSASLEPAGDLASVAPEPARSVKPVSKRRLTWRGCLGATALVALGLLLLIAGVWVVDRLQGTPTPGAGTAISTLEGQGGGVEATWTPGTSQPPDATSNSQTTTPALPVPSSPQTATATLTPWPLHGPQSSGTPTP